MHLLEILNSDLGSQARATLDISEIKKKNEKFVSERLRIMETPTRSLPPSPEISDSDEDWNRFGDEWRSFEEMDTPEKPSPPISSHQRPFEVRSRTPTVLTNRLERRKRPRKLPDQKGSNERSNEVKNDSTKKRRRKRTKDLDQTTDKNDQNEILDNIWEQVESVGTNLFRYFWPEKEPETPSPKEQVNGHRPSDSPSVYNLRSLISPIHRQINQNRSLNIEFLQT